MSRFRLNATHLLLTYPQCPVEKQEAFDFLMERLHPELLLVAREVHADGNYHLHAYCKLNPKGNFTDPHFADLRIGNQRYHGNYESCRSVVKAQKYAAKDGDYVSNFNPNGQTNKTRRQWAAEEIILKKRPLHEVVEEDPCLLFGYSKLKEDYNAFLRDKASTNVKSLPPFLPNPWGLVLRSGIQSKRRHFWLYSTRPNLGKSYHFAKPLQDEFGAVIQTGEFLYWNVFIGVKCIILDEYNSAQLKWSFLNAMCDGNFGYRIFHGGVVKLDQPLIIVLSNQSISELYPHKNEFLYARFFEKKLD